ncbi:MAG: ABC transporter ATP-binding protein [Sedimentisphaerales bacterium]|nr:ABC transporter ATP-binding protein [Sedimentisphaerales bacterium]
MNDASWIITSDLTKVYQTASVRLAALQGVNLRLGRGRFIGITGASGSGKSTLLNLLGGLDRPTRGTISVAGESISGLGRRELSLYRRHRVGMIFQSFNLIGSYTAADNVALPLLFDGVPKKLRRQRAAALLEEMGLADRMHHRPAELSGGEQQRVAIARALVNRPAILLADEPTGNLDSKTSLRIVTQLAHMQQGQNLTVLMISHEQALLKMVAHEIYCLEDGRIIEQETLRSEP